MVKNIKRVRVQFWKQINRFLAIFGTADPIEWPSTHENVWRQWIQTDRQYIAKNRWISRWNENALKK